MTCREARALFTRDLDGRLGAAEAAALPSHVAGCRQCAVERELWGAASRALRASGPTIVPQHLAARCVDSALRPRTRAAPSLAGWFIAAARPAAIAAAAAAAALWVTAAVADRPTPQPAQDHLELALQLWTAEVEPDAP